MSSEDQGKSKQEGLENYEKDYLERLQKLKDGQDLQNLIYNLSKDFKKPREVPKDYVGLCTFCMIGVPREEMAYKNSQLFHSICYEQQGKNFPAPNQELLKESSNAKVQLVILKNLKFRTGGDSSPSSPQPRPQPKKKSKPKAKKRRPKRRTAKKKRTSKKRPAKRRRVKPKRRKTVRRKKIVRRKTRRTPVRRTRRRPARRTRRRSKKRQAPRRR
ncbi:MAG: hypothetical protein V3V58_02420 [Nitrosopumilaceae archaeon]